MKILLTGITGYIGSNLARNLLKEHQVYGLVKMPLHTEYIEDIRHKLCLLPYDGTYSSMQEALNTCTPDLVYHLATYYTGSHNGEVLPAMVSANITLGLYLLEAMTQVGCHNLIYASSVMEHYQGKEYRPLNLYAATKRAFYDLLQYYSDAAMIRFGVLVLSDTYGPGDHRPKILNLIKQHAGTEEAIALSDGQQDYSAVYIDDVIRAFIMAGYQLCNYEWENKTFQISPEKIYTLRETVEKLLEMCPNMFVAQWGKRPAAEREIRKAVRLYPFVPNWTPQVPLKKGLQKFMTEETL